MKQETDFIVVGSGIAGLRAAIEIATSGASVTVLTKDRPSESNTEYAQGGIAVVLSDDDEIDLHLEDTLVAGAGLCDEDAVRTMVEDGPALIQELIDWGTQFDRESGDLLFTREAAHSRRRILHAHGDSTGHEIVRSLIAKSRTESNITFVSHADTEAILTVDGQCSGVRYIGTGGTDIVELSASGVVLATGGGGQLFQHTTNPDVATGDGFAMAYSAGAEMADMEFVQFHPTALNLPGVPRFLLSEAMRGEGGVLRNYQGERFMPRYHELADLAPRDIVSRSIVAEIARSGYPTVFLDMTALDREFIKERFPKIYTTCLQHGLDITIDRLPVSPAAHYCMGGVRTDLSGRTTIPGLYAAGEVACTGVHGANRLASNSLLEGLVFGARSGKAASKDNRASVGGKNYSAETVRQKAEDQQRLLEFRAKVKELMWQKVGIIRDGQRLLEALETIENFAHNDLTLKERNFLDVARLIARAAQWREESRGAHFRTDFPLTDEAWRVHSILQKDRTEIQSAATLASFSAEQ